MTMRRQQAFWIGALLLSLVLAGVVSTFASSAPDGLESVAERFGFSEQARDSAAADSPLSDYAVAGVQDERLSTALAGVVGVLLTGVVAGGLFLVLRRRPDREG